MGNYWSIDLWTSCPTSHRAPKTTHLNVHDVAGMLPMLRWVRAVGPTNPAAALESRNSVVADFIGHLRADHAGRIDAAPASVRYGGTQE